MFRPACAALAAVLALSAHAHPAHATIVTGYAMGRVGINLSYSSDPDFPSYAFTPGEKVYATFRYDDGLDPLMDPDVAGIDISTSTGFSASSPLMHRNSGSSIFIEDGVLARLLLTDSMEQDFDLRFDGDAVSMYFFDTSRTGGKGFRSSLTLVDGPEAFTAPEPSTLAMGLVGVGLAGLARLRRKAGRRGALAMATIAVAVLAVPASAQEPLTEQQEQSSRVLARRKVLRDQKARTRAYRASQEAQAAREQRAHELRMAPVVAKMQADRMGAALVADRNRAEYMKAQAQFAQAEMMRRQAAAISYQAWILSGRRSVYP